jgi:excisionase family DNA binding protein
MKPMTDKFLTPGEVAKILRVDPKTVSRWAAKNKIEHITTPGGHHRFPEDAVRALITPTQTSTTS